MTDAEGCRHNLCHIHATVKATPAEARGRAQCGHQTVANVCKGSKGEMLAASRCFPPYPTHAVLPRRRTVAPLHPLKSAENQAPGHST